MRHQRLSFLVKAIYFVCIAGIGIYCFTRPLYNWDMLPYAAIVLKWDGASNAEAHDLSYALTRKNIPAENYSQLTDSMHGYRNRMFKDPQAFESQLPFYVVKPLYTGLTYVSYRTGVALPNATLIPSLISFMLIGVLLFHWINIYLRLPMTLLVALAMMISSPMIEIAKTASPDCLSTLFLFAAFYCILEKPSLRWTYIWMLAALFARLDNIVTCLIILAFLYSSKNWYTKISFRTILSLWTFLVISYFLIGWMAMKYEWSIFFYPDFASRLHPAYGTNTQFSLSGYFRLMYEHALGGINHSYLAVFLGLLFLYLSDAFPFKKITFEQSFALIIPLILVLRFILYPDISDRFYNAFYLVIIILMVKKLYADQRLLS